MAKAGNFSKQMANKKRDVAKDLKNVEYNGAVESKDDYFAELSAAIMHAGKEKSSKETPADTVVEKQDTVDTKVQAEVQPEVSNEVKDTSKTNDATAVVDEPIKVVEPKPAETVIEDKKPTQEKPKTTKKETAAKSVKKEVPAKQSETVEPITTETEKTETAPNNSASNTQTMEPTPTDEPVISMKRKLPAEKSTHCQRNNCSTWNCTVKPECEAKFVYEAAVQGTTMMELINRIIYAEMEWLKQHPEFPSKEFVLSNIKNRKAIKHSRQDHVPLSIIFSPDAWEFVKVTSKRCGMHMNVYLEFLIDEYCVS